MRPRSLWTLALLAAIATVGAFAIHASRARSTAVLANESAASAVPWGPLSGRNYYVSNAGRDDQDGSASSPWATLQYAATKAEPGSTIHVLPGIYQGPIRTQRSGKGEARIRFLSEKQWQARIVTKGAPVVWRNDGDYVDIAGFDISGDGAQGILNMASNVRIVGNHVHDIPAAGCTSAGGAGIDNGSDSGHDNDVVGNLVNRIGDLERDCTRVHGIYHANFGGHIWNNISCDNQGWGIHLWHAPRSVVIANNLVCRNHHGGIVIGAGDSANALPADHILVTNNLLFGNGPSWSPYAIYESGLLGDDNHYLNNLIFGREQKIVLRNGNSISGTIWKDPMLFNLKGDSTADYRLTAGSPAIGSGTNAGAPPIDINGGARPVDGRWDVGPYEYQSRGKPWPWY